MENFLKEKYVIVSVMGSHAGESEEEIFIRKKKEIEKTDRSFWLHKSYNAKPDVVHDLCKKALLKKGTPMCIFIQASSEGGARPTKETDRAKEFSIDKNSWKKIPSGILVTGSIKNSFAMVFDGLKVVEKKQDLNLWDYSLFLSAGEAIKIGQGASTVCCIKESSESDSKKMKSNIRKIIAVGRLVDPFAVWLR